MICIFRNSIENEVELKYQSVSAYLNIVCLVSYANGLLPSPSKALISRLLSVVFIPSSLNLRLMKTVIPTMIVKKTRRISAYIITISVRTSQCFTTATIIIIAKIAVAIKRRKKRIQFDNGWKCGLKYFLSLYSSWISLKQNLQIGLLHWGLYGF